MTFTLSSSMFDVSVAAERGADIVQVVDRLTGLSTLSVSPTAQATTPRALAGNSMARWTSGYPGGWQFLTPNAGPEREHDGVLQDYNGESALSRWQVISKDESSAELSAHLSTAPLDLHRRIVVDDTGLTVIDTVNNVSPDDVSARILHHPAFGAPFLDDDSYLIIDAETLITDENAGGDAAGPERFGPPSSILRAGPAPRSVSLPGPGSGQAFLGGLTDFEGDESTATFVSPTHGFGMELSWQRDRFPMAWLWIEANAGSGWPWFRRMYASAVEPGNILPGSGMSGSGHLRGGPGTTIPGHGSFDSTVRLRRVRLPDPLITHDCSPASSNGES